MFIKLFNWRSKFVLILIALGFLSLITGSSVVFAQTTIYVDADTGAGGDGSSWGSAYKTLQDALENASSGDQIWVAEGTYYPDEGAGQTDNDRAASFQLISGVKVYGGFEGNESDLSERDWQANATILSGDVDGDNTSTNNSYHVVNGTGVDETAVLDGFTVTGGNADGASGSNSGGGIFIDNDSEDSSPIFSHLRITENEASSSGGGIYSDNSSYTLFNVEISKNAADWGGGMNVLSGHPKLLNVGISGNTAEYGGGIYNIADITLTNVSIYNNTAGFGGGIHHREERVDVQNSIVWGNTSDSSGDQVFVDDDPFSAPEVTYTNSLVEGRDLTGTGTGNLAGTAYTADQIFTDFSSGDYSLASGSDAINAGSNQVYSDAGGDLQNDNDLVGNPRLDATTIDIGAYEFQEASVPPSPEEGILYVNKNVSGGNGSGNSWSNAIPNLADAMKWAYQQHEDDETVWDSDPLEIWVAEGTYYPDEGAGQTDNDRDETFQLISGVKVYGGFEGNESDLTDRDWEEHITVLNGDIDGDNTLANNSLHVVNGTGVDGTAVLDGFTVTGGNADGLYNSDSGGGGIIIDNSPDFEDSGTIFSHLRITENEASSAGGGIYGSDSSFTLFNVEISKNTAGYGGGVYLARGYPKLLNVEISENTAKEDGGGLNLSAGHAMLLNVGIYNNSAESGGGGGISSSSNMSITLTNASIHNNSSGEDGGGVNNRGDIEIQNSILWGNTSGSNGDQIYVDSFSDPEVTYTNSLVEGHDLTGTGTGNLDGTAYTAEQIFTDFSGEDYSLASGSDAINAGSNQVYSDAGGDLQNDNDLAGNPRVFDGETDVIDIGAYEYQGEPFSIDPDDKNILYVDQNVSGGNGSGDSWSNAIPNLADAMKWAYQQHEGDETVWDSDPLEIWVAEGTYYPDEGAGQTDNDREASFQLISGVKIYGGFEGNESDLSERDWQANATILSGNIDGDNTLTNNSYHVVNGSGVDETTVLDGFTVTGGNANGASAGLNSGGGIFIDNDSEGDSAPIFSHLRITENEAYVGGGIYSDNSSYTLFNVEISKNTAGDGGGMVLLTGDATLLNVGIYNNSADDGGGGVYNQGDANFQNSIVWGNTADEEDQVDNRYANSVVYTNSLVEGLDLTGTGSDNLDGTAYTADQIFTDFSGGDYSLAFGSDAINAGSNQVYSDAGGDLQNDNDLAGNPRVFDGETDVIDIGAYEYQDDPVTVPDPVVLSAPEDEENNVGLTPEFSWQLLDGADEYQLQVSENEEFSSTVIDQSELVDTTFEPSGDLDNSATYYWRVRASNAAGDGDWSEIFSFSTLPESSEIVILTEPSDNSEDVPLKPLFEWNPADGADSYDLIVSPNGDLSDPVIDEDEIDDTEFQFTDNLNFSTTYHWRVRGVNASGPGQWSESFSFTTQDQPEAADNRILLANTQSYTFSPSDFGTGDNSFTVVMDEIPTGFNGTLELDGNPVSNDDEISVTDISDEKLIYTPQFGGYGYGFDNFEFSIKDAGNNISEESYTMSLDVAATSVDLDYDGEGWRFLASPVNGETIGDFFESIWTQGFSGSDNPGATFTNIQVLNQSEYEWEPVDDANDNLDAGAVVTAYVFADDDNNGSNDGFPKTLSSSIMNWMDLDGSYNQTLDYDSEQQNNEDSFYLWGNPYPVAVDLCEMDLTNIAGNAYYWDPSLNSGNGDYVNLSCAADDVEIAPFQAVWVRVTNSSNNFEIPAESYMQESTTGYFKQNQSEDQFLITMNLTSQEQQEQMFATTTRILFNDEALNGSDLIDAPKLSSAGLATRYLSLYSMDESNNPYALQARPMDISEKVRIPLDIQTTESGRFTLDWDLPKSHVFNGSYFLRDNETGDVIELRDGSSYSFKIREDQVIQTKEAETTQPMSEISGTGVAALSTHRTNSEDTPRFELLIANSGVDGLTELGSTPEEFTLAQNYPNPFNPTTVISYQLPVSSQVRLEVYDMLGRTVATLVNEQVAAGRHTVNFDAGNLSSGVYLYRLQAGSQIMTRKLTVLK